MTEIEISASCIIPSRVRKRLPFWSHTCSLARDLGFQVLILSFLRTWYAFFAASAVMHAEVSLCLVMGFHPFDRQRDWTNNVF